MLIALKSIKFLKIKLKIQISDSAQIHMTVAKIPFVEIHSLLQSWVYCSYKIR